jgi:hypothetical protein
MYTAWSDFCSFNGRPLWTHALILTPFGLDFMRENRDDGKTLGVHGSDTGVPDDELSRKRRNDTERQRNYRRNKRGGSFSSIKNSPADDEASPQSHHDEMFGNMLDKINSLVDQTFSTPLPGDHSSSSSSNYTEAMAMQHQQQQQQQEATAKYKNLEIQVMAASALQTNTDEIARSKGTCKWTPKQSPTFC